MKKLLAFLSVALVAGGALAEIKPFQFSLTPDIALFDRAETIDGLTLGLWSENPQTALALGVVNGSTGRSAGLSLGLLANYADNYKGIQLAPVNVARGAVSGWQGGIVNFTEDRMAGLQIGVVNIAGRLTGLQLGLINYAATAKMGVQIGLVNLIPENEWFDGLPGGLPEGLGPGMIVVNLRF